jgi:DNA-binding IclR family transcriptional regulator
LSHTLTQLGYLRYREEFGKYELAAGVVGLAYPYLANQAVPPIARPLMAELAQKTGTNVGLGVQEDLSVFYLEYALGEVNPSRLHRAGFRVPVARTAMGRACIAGMGADQREQLYAHMRLYYKSEWPALRKQLDDAVSQVQMHGYCIAASTFNATTNAVAVPFIAGDGQTPMAFNSLGHTQRQTASVMARNGRKLLDLVQTVRRRLAEAPRGPSLGPPLMLDVTTAPGRVGGSVASPEVHAWKGIPYAAAPVGPLRWRAPQPVTPWVGIRPARTFGPDFPQAPNPASRAGRMSEDCLYLNVWAPADAAPGSLP